MNQVDRGKEIRGHDRVQVCGRCILEGIGDGDACVVYEDVNVDCWVGGKEGRDGGFDGCWVWIGEVEGDVVDGGVGLFGCEGGIGVLMAGEGDEVVALGEDVL